MSKPPKADKRVYVRCPWCSRQPVQLKRGRLVSHVTPGNQRCIGEGQPYNIVAMLGKRGAA